MVELDVIITTVTTSIITILGSIFAFIKWYLPWKDSRNKISFKTGLGYLQKINNILDTVIHDLEMKTAVLFSGHNGGGIPRVDHEFFTSALMWGGGYSFKDLADWREIHANGNSINYLMEIVNKKEYILELTTLSESYTKSFFLQYGCNYIYFRYIDIIDNNLIYFLSGSESPITDIQLNRLRIESQKIITVFNDNIDHIKRYWK